MINFIAMLTHIHVLFCFLGKQRFTLISVFLGGAGGSTCSTLLRGTLCQTGLCGYYQEAEQHRQLRPVCLACLLIETCFVAGGTRSRHLEDEDSFSAAPPPPNPLFLDDDDDDDDVFRGLVG